MLVQNFLDQVLVEVECWLYMLLGEKYVHSFIQQVILSSAIRHGDHVEEETKAKECCRR